ncbi:hypothetical protein [Aquihabitans sp. G128]|uniref:hypothetical protein n=1 Tax=Aquihabitans sp. G128 TaxID=2849779 RepID=UPI0020B377ED|nr:hypothetical protein [Aquihabitans sp. G128]
MASTTRDRPQMQEELASRESMILAFVTGMIQSEADRFAIELAIPAADLATVLVSLGEGLAFSRMLQQDAPTTVLSDLARVVFLGRR